MMWWRRRASPDAEPPGRPEVAGGADASDAWDEASDGTAAQSPLESSDALSDREVSSGPPESDLLEPLLPEDNPEERHLPSFDTDAVWRALAAARRQALDVYARHKLPLAPALYRRRGDRHSWRPAEADMTAEQRWAFVLDGAEAGWRLVGLERVGRIGRARVIEVQMASEILGLTEALRRRLPELDAAERADIGRAFELGRLTAAAEARAELMRRRRRRRERLRARAKARQAGASPPDRRDQD